MRIAEIIGRVTLSKWHESLGGATWLVAVPLSYAALQGERDGRGEPYVIYDDRGAAEGTTIAVAEGPEASAPFAPEQKPIDAYDAAILDEIDIS